jgi:hypothetical protein
MKSIALLIGFCMSCGTAVAQTSECQYVTKASDRLACYDKVNPPLSRNKAREISQAPSSAPEKGDALAIEDARLASKIKNICRGC